MSCLENGFFSRSTVKPLEKIFDLDREKSLIRTYLEHGEWFMVSGVRRVGKTTLVRSILNNLNVQTIYINLWSVSERDPFEDFVYRLSRGALGILDRSFRKKLKRIEELSMFGLRVRLSYEQKEFFLDEILSDITSKNKVIIVIDEIQEMENNIKTFAKFLSSLHDALAPKLGIVILGSIASVRQLFDMKINETEPLFGRVTKEFLVKPFDKALALQFLRKGFEECEIDYSQEELDKAVDFLGTITGWLVEFGREYVLEKTALKNVDVDKVLETVFNQSKKIVYGEIARALRGKKRFDVYLKILKLIAATPYISLSELSTALKRKKPTILQYTGYLISRNIISSEKGQYNIVDPLYRRAILSPSFEAEVKIRL
ncbi:MAG: AAA family ATPase [Candidatus Njordarchaeia archaeon]